MKYCKHCGGELVDDAVICIHCGCSVENPKMNNPTPSVSVHRDRGLDVAIKIFMVLGIVSSAWALIPLAWTIPMTVHCFRCIDQNKPMGTGFKVCTLLFVGLIAGILLLSHDEYDIH